MINNKVICDKTDKIMFLLHLEDKILNNNRKYYKFIRKTDLDIDELINRADYHKNQINLIKNSYL